MSEKQTKNKNAILELGIQSASKKMGESAANRALNGILDNLKNVYDGAQIHLGTAFKRYLENAVLRYNKVRTLATGQTPRNIIGQDNIYVGIGVQYGNKEIDTATVESLLKISNNILIQGTGGIGKSMLMRYLFLNTADRGTYVPVLLQLRRISNQDIKQISILDLIYTSMEDFDIQLPKEQFEYSLRLGKYLFLLDGFDEVKEEMAKGTAEAIQKFCAKYPKNPCIITSRPRRNVSPLETFTEVKSKTLDLEQAVLLASKIWKEDEKTREFCRQLREGLYAKHKEFAENPLLLSMMFLTFMKNNSVPEHLAEFYNKAFDAIYCAHDSHDKGYFLREFKCKDLDESGFKKILYYFCFHTYFKEMYEFSEEQVILFLKRAIEKQNIENINPKKYLQDLCNVVCILVEEGEIYRFSHRSFQTYFAACYTSSALTDEQQKKLFASNLSTTVYWSKSDYYELLAQIEYERFVENALEDGIRCIQDKLRLSHKPEEKLITSQFEAFEIQKEEKRLAFLIGECTDSDKNYNMIALFSKFIVNKENSEFREEDMDVFIDLTEKIRVDKNNSLIDFNIINTSEKITDAERQFMWDVIIANKDVKNTILSINSWLKELENGRKALAEENFIDTL